MRARRPTSRAQPAVRDNRTRDRRSRREGYRQEQFSERVPRSSAPVPTEIGRFLNAEDGEAGEKVTSAHDWTGHQLRKKGNGENEIPQRFRWSQHSPINVEGVRK